MFYKKTIILLSLFLTFPSFGLTVDFMPLAVGNTWVFKDSSFGIPYGNYNYIHTFAITAIGKTSNDTILFTASVHDSGIIEGPNLSSRQGDTTYTVSCMKTKDSIFINGAYSPFFPYSKCDTASWDSTSLKQIQCILQCNNYKLYFSIGNKTYLVYVAQQISLGIASDSLIAVENVGIISRKLDHWVHCTMGSCGASKKLTLLSFNGKPVDVPFDGVVRTSANHSPYLKSPAITKIVSFQGMPATLPGHINIVFDIRGRMVPQSDRLSANGVYFVVPINKDNAALPRR